MDGFVYVIGEPGSSVVKIGLTWGSLEKRLYEIQLMSPVRLRVLWSCAGDNWVETGLHRRFADRRTHGEWFDFGDEDPISAISSAAPEVIAAVEQMWAAPRPRNKTAKSKQGRQACAYCKHPGHRRGKCLHAPVATSPPCACRH